MGRAQAAVKAGAGGKRPPAAGEPEEAQAAREEGKSPAVATVEPSASPNTAPAESKTEPEQPTT